VPLYSIVSKKIYRSQAGVILELLQKYNSRPALRVGLSESDCTRISGVLTLHLKPPANPMEVRANVERSYAVMHGSQLARTVQREVHSNAFKGWTSTYDASADYQRMGLLNPLSHWRVSEQNADYQLCGTYPAKLVVPRSVKDDDLLKASLFRSGRRVPVLCWKDPFGVASICRSSQPCVGVSKWACPQDEALLQQISAQLHSLEPAVCARLLTECRFRDEWRQEKCERALQQLPSSEQDPETVDRMREYIAMLAPDEDLGPLEPGWQSELLRQQRTGMVQTMEQFDFAGKVGWLLHYYSVVCWHTITLWLVRRTLPAFPPPH
jgi:hypothetical protein